VRLHLLRIHYKYLGLYLSKLIKAKALDALAGIGLFTLGAIDLKLLNPEVMVEYTLVLKIDPEYDWEELIVKLPTNKLPVVVKDPVPLPTVEIAS
jgi:hypothetical protein